MIRHRVINQDEYKKEQTENKAQHYNCIQLLFPQNYGAYENRQMRKTIDLIENGARPYLAETLSHIVEAKESLN